MKFVTKTFADFKSVADAAIEEIEKNWIDPFEEPVLLFSSPSVKKWFTKYWVQKKGVVANVQTPDIEGFLWKSLDPKEDEVLITTEISTQLILTTLKSKIDNGGLTGDYEGLADYLSSDSDEDAASLKAKIADLSLTLAGKFREYEFAFYDDMDSLWNANAAVAKWQKALYQEAFGKDGLLEKASKVRYQEIKGDGLTEVADVRYYTLPGLYKKRLTSGAMFSEKLKGARIYLVGQFSIGQFHRDLLRKLSEVANVTLYIPVTECVEIPEWTAFAKNNLCQWDSSAVIESKKNLPFDRIEVVSAPSKLREIENLYQRVWEYVDKEKARLDEMLVLIPNLDAYRPSIERVFAGHSLQYNYANSSESASLVSKAVGNLMNMAATQEINRFDFLALINNPLVKAAKKISDDDCDVFEKWILNANIYREYVQDRLNPQSVPTVVNPVNLWSSGTDRLLLSYITSNSISYGEDDQKKVLTPYQDIESADRSLVEKFCRLVDDVVKFIRERSCFGQLVDEEDENVCKTKYWKNIDIIKDMLDPRDFKDEVPVYRDILRVLYNLNWNRYATADSNAGNDGEKFTDFEQLRFVVKSALVGIESHRGKFLLDGLNFAKFTTECFVPVKKIFMVGMGSLDFPGRNSDSTLDLRVALDRKGLPDKVAQNLNAFFNELICANQVYISYESLNAKEAAELYPSSVISELLSVANGNIKVLELGFDFGENERNGQVFGVRRLCRDYVDQIVKAKDFVESSDKLKSLSEIKVPEDDDTSDLISFLTNPFEFKLKKVLRIFEDKDASLNAFEPIELDSLMRNSLDKEVFIKVTEGNVERVFNVSSREEEKIKSFYQIQKEYTAFLSEMSKEYSATISDKKSLEEAVKVVVKKANQGLRTAEIRVAVSENKDVKRFTDLFEKLMKARTDIKLNKKVDADSDEKKIAELKVKIEKAKKNAYIEDCVLQSLQQYVNLGQLPANPCLLDAIKRDMTKLLNKQIGSYDTNCGDVSEVVLYKACSSKTASYRHWIELYVRALKMAALSESTQMYSLLVVPAGKLAEKSLKISPEDAKSILAQIETKAYKEPFHANIPCDVIGAYLESDPEKCINESTPLDVYCDRLDPDSYESLNQFPSEAARLFSREDWGLEEWPKPLTEYMGLVKMLCPEVE